MNLILAAAEATTLHTFLVQVMGFVLLCALLGPYIVRLFRKILSERAQGFDDTFRRLEHEAEETSGKMAEVQNRLARKGEEGKLRLAAALDEGARMKAQALADANAGAHAALERASREIAMTRDQAILELRRDAVLLTLNASEAALHRLVTPEVHRKLVDDYLRTLESVKS